MFFNRKETQKRSFPEHDKLAGKLAGKIISVQLKIAWFLNKKTQHYSRIQKEVLLVSISAFFSAVCLYLIFNSIL
jgi:hypothetical protein